VIYVEKLKNVESLGLNADWRHHNNVGMPPRRSGAPFINVTFNIRSRMEVGATMVVGEAVQGTLPGF
jgi:hypothetical protein